MVDRRRIVEQWKRSRAKALVTLVRAEGSSYRSPGAHLLIGANGESAGTISGGCLEAEVVRKAAWMVRGGATVQRYSTLFDDTAEIPYGLGCGGVVDLLIEPANTAEATALLQAMETSLTGAEMRVATWLPVEGSPLRRLVLDATGGVNYASAGLREYEIEAVTNCGLLPEQSSNLYIERLGGPLRLFLFGAGDDAKPVVNMAAMMGWRVTVSDGRAQLARAERFPQAERVLASTSVTGLDLTAEDAVVLMTHSYEQDHTLLTALLSAVQGPGYIGLLGAAHRSSLLISEAASAIGASVAACCERVWSPVGLDLGGDGAEAIALSVVAEVQAWRQGKFGSSRRLTPERIAEHIAQGGARQYLQAQCALGIAE